jgi:hypothetical protein
MTNTPKKTTKLIKGNKKHAVEANCIKMFGGNG